jgi:N-acetyl-anhydromuramyl-L-alanine amidase AmpD
MRPLNEIIVHCSATRPEWMERFPTAKKVEEIRRWHMGAPNKWKDIGYHYLVDRNGTVVTGRPIEQVGSHVKGHNTGTIGVCLIGGHGSAETDQFAEHFTPAQDKALRHLLADLQHRYKIGKVTGHNSYAAKACPGFNVPKWLGGHVNKPAKSEHVHPDVLTHKPITPGMTANPNQPKHWLTHVLAALAAIADLFKRK